MKESLQVLPASTLFMEEKLVFVKSFGHLKKYAVSSKSNLFCYDFDNSSRS